ncbi:MAG: plastocyanin/azurin family copper-binding protein [Ktedonobacterales bacterium]
MRESTSINQVGKLALLLPVLLLLVLALASCGNTATGSENSSSNGSTSSGGTVSNTVYMNSSDFTVHNITVAANQPVHFSDTVDGGGLHIICLGTGNGGTNTCLQNGDAPAGLLGKGTTFNPGETKDFTFTAPGTYHVICTVHPGMYIDITAS